MLAETSLQFICVPLEPYCQNSNLARFNLMIEKDYKKQKAAWFCVIYFWHCAVYVLTLPVVWVYDGYNVVKLTSQILIAKNAKNEKFENKLCLF